MPTLAHHQRRRTQLLDQVQGPVLLMAGGMQSRNYPHNYQPYRAEGSFLFFFAQPEPGAAAIFDPADRSVTLFLPARTPEDALWHGAVPDFATMKATHGVSQVLAVEQLEDHVKKLAKGRKLQALAAADHKATRRASAITGETLDFERADKVGDPQLIAAIAKLRNHKEDEELQEMRKTAVVTKAAHIAAMSHTKAGIVEQELAGIVDGTFARHGCVPAYNTILSVRGEVLHNNAHGNVLNPGDIVLLDGGAENASGYCSDVTRCWPVGRFSSDARVVYETVLKANLAGIALVKPGTRYRDIHMASARVIAEGLVQLGVLRGNVDALVESGAHALFFPHGVGHLIGLDVHDMESFGDQISYARGRTRSTQFGTAYLRMDLDLAPGICVTIEPGIYFVPAILHDEKLKKQFKDQVDFARAEQFLKLNQGRGFGGIRIEDDVACTKSGCEVLTAAIPKELDAVEALSGCAT